MSTGKKDIPNGWFTAERFINRRISKKIGKTGLVWRGSIADGDPMYLRLHHTNIVTWWLDGRIKVNLGDWDSVTTRSWINRALRGTGFRVYRHKGTTWITYFSGVAERDRIKFDKPRVLNPHPGVLWIADEVAA